MLRRVFTILCLLLLPLPALAGVAVQEVRLGEPGGRTRFMLELGEIRDFRVTLADGPKRVVVEMPALDFKHGPSGNGRALIKSWKAETEGATTRLILELAKPAKVVNAVGMLPDGHSPARFVLDLEPTGPIEFALSLGKSWGRRAAPAAEPASRTAAAAFPGAGTLRLPPGMEPKPAEPKRLEPVAPTVAAPKAPAPVDTPSQPKQQAAVTAPAAALPTAPTRPSSGKEKSGPRLIVLDAGHGGVDPGAESVNGYFEKEVTYANSLAVKRALEESGRYRVVLTRPTDDFVVLGDRVKLGRQAAGELFISLHADSTADGPQTVAGRSARGATVYTLSGKASDAQAERLARKENRADLLGGVAVGDDDVAGILADLTMRETNNQSNRFAATVVHELQSTGIRTVANPHRSAGFAVLKAPDMPSILVEMGYLSDSSDSKLLADPTHQRRFAQAMLHAVDRYFAAISGPVRR
ncbi:N-acetylmuramoyl-L-alanine amidase family protein [Roseiterribacter gracilis]|uniref:N-acetylmuramoyl-L-alanine amidase n=1 Tax=Roseiterribacter gracilis TaxID=2812848 RepID=A0A8S8XJP5_9PROT|nr:N-acetylmuramoyl-L-alanine amidase [Rhodospirillales bacterium TMPK1]